MAYWIIVNSLKIFCCEGFTHNPPESTMTHKYSIHPTPVWISIRIAKYSLFLLKQPNKQTPDHQFAKSNTPKTHISFTTSNIKPSKLQETPNYYSTTPLILPFRSLFLLTIRLSFTYPPPSFFLSFSISSQSLTPPPFPPLGNVRGWWRGQVKKRESYSSSLKHKCKLLREVIKWFTVSSSIYAAKLSNFHSTRPSGFTKRTKKY